MYDVSMRESRLQQFKKKRFSHNATIGLYIYPERNGFLFHIGPNALQNLTSWIGKKLLKKLILQYVKQWCYNIQKRISDDIELFHEPARRPSYVLHLGSLLHGLNREWLIVHIITIVQVRRCTWSFKKLMNKNQFRIFIISCFL